MGEDESPRRALLAALGAMAGVALISGLAIGAVAVVVFDVAGVGGSATQDDAGAPATLTMPSYSPTRSSDDDGLGLPSYSAPASPTLPSQAVEPTPQGDKITLFVAPAVIAPGERINFNGVYPDGDGTSLQIQRKEAGRWVDFPVQAQVVGGVFETWIQTSRPGRTVFRVVDPGAGRESNAVTVQIG